MLACIVFHSYRSLDSFTIDNVVVVDVVDANVLLFCSLSPMFSSNDGCCMLGNGVNVVAKLYKKHEKAQKLF